jgi:predicted RNase H-like HicB family nuclease
MAKTTTILQFKVLIERDESGWYVASVPELPGCYTQAKTIEELRSRVKEAIELVLETDAQARKEKLKSPTPIPSFFATEDIAIPYYA